MATASTTNQRRAEGPGAVDRQEMGAGRVGPPLAVLVGAGLVLFSIGLAARLAFAGSAPVFLEGDSQSYLLPGWELATGRGFSPELRRAPGYPFFIAGSFSLFGQDLSSLALAQHAAGLASVGLTFLIGWRLFGWAAGLLAGLALALSGPQLIYERYVMTEALFGFLLAAASLAMLATLQQESRQSSRLPFLAGLLIGLAALARPVGQALVPIFLLAILLARPRWRPAMASAGLALAGYLLILAPWTLRNLAAHETAAAGGLGRSLIARTVKYDALFDWKWLSETYGGRDDPPARARMLLYRKRANIPESRSVRPYQDALINELGLSQAQADAVMREIAFEAIARRPLDYLRGSLFFTSQLVLGQEEPLRSHWRQRANKDWGEQWDDRLDHLVTPVAAWTDHTIAASLANIYQPARFAWPLAALTLAGCYFAVRGRRRRPGLLLAASALLLLALSAFLDGPVQRYRHPVEPLLTVLAAGGFIGLVSAVRSVLQRRPVSPADDGARALPLRLREG